MTMSISLFHMKNTLHIVLTFFPGGRARKIKFHMKRKSHIDLTIS